MWQGDRLSFITDFSSPSNSELSEQMYADGYHNIVNIDFSGEVIRLMRERTKQCDRMQWIEMDARNMAQFENGTFDIVIDKGTLDAVLTEQQSVWEVEPHLAEQIDAMLAEVQRVMKPTNSAFIYITFGQKHFRQKLLDKPERYHWTFDFQTIGEGFHYFVYTCKR
jgi:ubiquinone/menaquinone biosynthesis C-methylase UbiE